MPKTSNQKYYEENKEKLKAKRRMRYQKKKKLQQQLAQQKNEQNTEQNTEQKNLFHFPNNTKGDEMQNSVSTITELNPEQNSTNKDLDYYALGKVCVLLLVSTAIVLLFYFQTLPLYRVSKFYQPIFASIGSLVVLFGFAAVKAVRKSFLTDLLCVCVLLYEFSFIYYGSSQNEKALENDLHQQIIANDNSLKVLESEINLTKRKYQSKLSQFEDPLSKVHNNSWFKKVHLQPALLSWKKATDTYEQRKVSILPSEATSNILHLKIAYRLLLVLLCMIVSHYFVKELLGFLRAHKRVIRAFSQRGKEVVNYQS